MSVLVRVPAKVNLVLGVGPRRDDGFHELATVYQAVDLYDEIRATARDDDRVTVRTQVEADGTGERTDVPDDERNLAVRAALALRAYADQPLGVDLAVRKSIPVAGGMAGGSADAAGALVACNALWGLGLTREQLEPLAADLGSDVPFLLHGGHVIGAGRGEQLTPVLAPTASYHWVIVTADDGLSTPDVYAEFDRVNVGRAVPDPRVPDELIAALRAGDPFDLALCLSNDLQEPALRLRPELRRTLEAGERAGALVGVISGSGPTVLLLCANAERATEVASVLAATDDYADVLQARGPVPGARVVG